LTPPSADLPDLSNKDLERSLDGDAQKRGTVVSATSTGYVASSDPTLAQGLFLDVASNCVRPCHMFHLQPDYPSQVELSFARPCFGSRCKKKLPVFTVATPHAVRTAQSRRRPDIRNPRFSHRLRRGDDTSLLRPLAKGAQASGWTSTRRMRSTFQLRRRERNGTCFSHGTADMGRRHGTERRRHTREFCIPFFLRWVGIA
jgi:hypothetical protein